MNVTANACGDFRAFVTVVSMAIKWFRSGKARGGSASQGAEWNFRQEWDAARASAMSPADLAEIDAMFARYDAERAARSR